MYWFKINNIQLLCGVILCISGLAACQPDVHKQSAGKKYFDLKGFIGIEAAKLNKAHTTVNKTVDHNNSAGTQTKTIKINWEKELGLFTASDINKPAWQDSYRIEQKGDSVIYTALQPELATRRLVIWKDNGKVEKIAIDNATHNLLYHTTEKLLYYPDSLYLINKIQKVKLMGENRYLIKGEIIK